MKFEKAAAKIGWAALLAASAASCAQPPGPQPQPDAVVRAFDDPACGARWLLVRDAARPGGPGRLLPVPLERGHGGTAAATENPMIRAGDRIVLEEHTRVVEARLEAVALGPAREGERFKARLKIGGKVVDAEAAGAGRAVFVPESQAFR